MPEPTTPTPTDPNSGDPNAGDPSMDSLLPTTPPTGDEQQETVTIEQGDHQISVTSPDGQGQVTVTVDDGSGIPKTYNLNFGGPDAAAGLTPGQAPPTQGAPGSDAARGVPGSDAIQPGPDGTCVIEDGDLKITAERPAGQPDTVLVTVDDGTGEPTSYNLDYSTPSGATTLPAPAPGPGEFRTMPAEQELATGRPMPVVEPGAIPRQQDIPVTAAAAIDPAEQYGTTSPQASGSLSNDNNGGDAGLSRAPDSDGGDAGLSRANDSQYADVGRPGEAGLSSADDTAGGHAQPGMAGMPMLGGVGGGGGGEDQQRTTTQWKTTGDLFDDGTDARMSDLFGERR